MVVSLSLLAVTVASLIVLMIVIATALWWVKDKKGLSMYPKNLGGNALTVHSHQE